jgi:hypothetical protein
MVRKPRYGLIKLLEAELPRGSPFDRPRLDRLGISGQLAAHYVRSGWLVRLGQGVYAFPGDEPGRMGAVKLLQERVEGLHVGGRSALALQGVRHNLSARDTLVLWGDVRFALPGWFTSRYPARYVGARLFDWGDDALPRDTVTTPPGAPPGLRASTPERAALEMLYDVGPHEGLEEARNVFESLRNLRRDVVGQLLACCTSVKAVRLFLRWSRETNLLDVDALRRRFALRVGSDRRWITRLKDGTLLSLKPYG